MSSIHINDVAKPQYLGIAARLHCSKRMPKQIIPTLNMIVLICKDHPNVVISLFRNRIYFNKYASNSFRIKSSPERKRWTTKILASLQKYAVGH